MVRRFLTARTRLTEAPNARTPNRPGTAFDTAGDAGPAGADSTISSKCDTSPGTAISNERSMSDGHVDIADFATFSACYTGSNGSGQDTWHDGRTLPEHMYEILCEICRDRGVECPGENQP